MACCEILKAEPGAYVLYLRAEPDDPEFILELLHEVAHLIDPGFYDWCVEGINTVFSQRMAERCGFSWAPWQKQFESGGDRDPYAVAWRMMSEVADAVDPADLKTLLTHRKTWNHGERLAVDLDAWLRTLPPEARARAEAIFGRFGPILLRTKRKENFFAMPGTAAPGR
jgi:hypothetical protein